MQVDSGDIDDKLKRESTVVVRRESGPEHAVSNV